MFQFFFKTVFVLFICVSSFQAYAQTTMSEYNYLIKGYKLDVDTSRGVKPGYKISDFGKYSTIYGGESKNMQVKKLEKNGKLVATLLVFSYGKNAPKANDYHVIPHYLSSQEVWEKAEQRYKTYFSDCGSGRAYTWNFAKYISFLLYAIERHLDK